MPFGINRLRQQAIFDTFGNPVDDSAPSPQVFNPMGDISPSVPEGVNVQQLSAPAGPQEPDFVGGNDDTPFIGPPTPVNPQMNADVQGLRAKYNPNLKSDAEDKFNALLAAYPQHTPDSLGRKIVAAMVGFKGGPDAAQKIMNQPFAQAEADWKNQVGPAYQSANLERQGNINERQIAAVQNNYDIQQQRVDATNKKNQQSYEIAKQKNDLLDLKQQGYTFTVVGDKFIAHAPDGSEFDTGYDASKHTPVEVAEITSKARVQAAQISADARKATSGPGSAKPQVYQDTQGNLYSVNASTGERSPIADAPDEPVGSLSRMSAPHVDSAATMNYKQNKQLKDLVATHPEFQPLVKADQKGNLTVIPRPTDNWFTSHADQKALWDKFNVMLHPNYKSPDSSGGSTGDTGAGKPIIQHSPSTGKYRISNDGGATWQPYTPPSGGD